MRVHQAQIRIQASAARVWALLLDTATWPEWDPSCERIEGQVEPGATIKAFTKLSPGRAFPVKVTTLEAPSRMVWTGGMPLGLFKGERSFTLRAAAGEGTDFELKEVFSGPMLAVIGRTIPDLTPAFEGFCAGLKARAEAAG